MIRPDAILRLPGSLTAAARDAPREQAAIARIAPELAEHRYLLLTTYRRDGTPVGTPVWFAADGERLVVASQAGAWKVKRLRREPRALGAGCDARGTPKGPDLALRGEVLPAGEHEAAERALQRRYGASAWGFRQLSRLAGRGARDYLALRPAPAADPAGTAG